MDASSKPLRISETKRYSSIAWAIGIGSLVAFATVIFLYLINFRHSTLSVEPEDWGRFGEYVGGLAGTVVSAMALVTLAINLHLQAKELREARANARSDRRHAEQALYDQRRYEERRVHPLIRAEWRIDAEGVGIEVVTSLVIRNIGLGPCILQSLSFNEGSDGTTLSARPSSAERTSLAQAIKQIFEGIFPGTWNLDLFEFETLVLAPHEEFKVTRAHTGTTDPSLASMVRARLQKQLTPVVYFQNMIGTAISTKTQFNILKEASNAVAASQVSEHATNWEANDATRNRTTAWTHIVFCAVWAVTVFVFARLAYDSYSSLHTELARFPVINAPTWGSAQMMGIDVPKMLASIADANNQNVVALENSIRDSAKLTLGLNSVSSLMALLGLAAQIRVYRHERRKYIAFDEARGG